MYIPYSPTPALLPLLLSISIAASEPAQLPIKSLALPSSPKNATIHRYPIFSSCSSTSTQHSSQNTASYAPDKCHDINPHLLGGMSISDPAICANGTRANIVVYPNSLCLELDSGTKGSVLEVVDDVLDRCLNVEEMWSFAFICEGIETLGAEDIAWAFRMLGVMKVVLVVGAALVMVMVSCAGLVLVVGGLGLMGWGIWRLGKLCLRAFAVSKNDTMGKKGEEKPVKED